MLDSLCTQNTHIVDSTDRVVLKHHLTCLFSNWFGLYFTASGLVIFFLGWQGHVNMLHTFFQNLHIRILHEIQTLQRSKLITTTFPHSLIYLPENLLIHVFSHQPCRCTSTAPDLYLEGPQFEYWPEHSLFWLTCFLVFLIPCRETVNYATSFQILCNSSFNNQPCYIRNQDIVMCHITMFWSMMDQIYNSGT